MSEVQQDSIAAAKAKIEEMQNRKEEQEQAGGAQETPPRSIVPRRGADIPSKKGIRPVSGKPKEAKKKTFGQELKEALFGEGIGDGSIPKYIFFQMFIPSFKRIVADMCNGAINMAFGLDPKTRTIRSGEVNRFQSNASTFRDRNFANRGSSRYGRESVSDYEWDGPTADDIYNQIADLMDRFQEVSLAEVYSIMNMPEKIRTTDKNWGWVSMERIDLVCLDTDNDIWRIEFPRIREL